MTGLAAFGQTTRPDPLNYSLTVFAPVGAQLIQRKIVQPRILIVVSIVTGAALATDHAHYVLARAFQGLGYGFFFVPVNVIAYSQLSPDQNNKASSLTSLFRNWGGCFGIAFITTATERRAQFHQTNAGAAIGSPQFQNEPAR
jgi:MFS transporter, DHA2 family, multidrug resistance protein